MRRIICSALVTSVGLVALTGCAGGDDSSSGTFVSREGANEVYRASIADLDFPDGYRPSQTIPGIDQDSADTTYQQTYGDTRAHYLWQCVWEQEWLDTRATDADAAERAIEQLAKAPTMAYLADSRRADDATRRLFTENLDKAELGDPSGVQEDVDVNCS